MSTKNVGQQQHLPYKLFGKFVTARLVDTDDVRQGYIIDLRLPHFRIVGKSGEEYICCGNPVVVPSVPPLYVKNKDYYSFDVSLWEADEYIVIFKNKYYPDGIPVGGTLSKHDAETVMEWLSRNMRTLKKLFTVI
jgi:hypothetical protein